MFAHVGLARAAARASSTSLSSRACLRCQPVWRRYASAAAGPQWFTETEENNAQVLDAAKVKVDECNAARGHVVEPGDDIADQRARSKIIKEWSGLTDAYEKYSGIRKALVDVQPHLSDPDASLRELFEMERDDLLVQLDEALAALPALLLPQSESASLPAMLSLNAGVGGSESGLFAEELARMYTRFGERRGWKSEVISQTEGPVAKGGGGLREVTIKFEPPPFTEDEQVFGLLKWERGVHRVQRVPITEQQGRVHTSTVACVVLPIYPDTADAPLVDPKDVKSEVMRSRGAGGQHVNKTESAVRLTHLPTGISVSMQDSRSQHQNRAWAWDILRARLSERKRQAEVEAKRASRQSQVASAGRSDKVRTYNFPQDRLTDHRIGLSLTGLKEIMDGAGLEHVVNALNEDLDTRRLESILAGEGDFDE
ncbi:uncharacterized protein EHS24_009066 [Apiotrichum porosum]|uniref:Prokaryotic-type class I peptide chain release factors domain-containing protein n=1 Tax=Apiotrichum porosum TaxID=105984 RepID=A0A427XNL7_9TREE|nr:uncharacterized protein EHS24_009066 [Apiotrichum porosum]RSH80486.1 hypothetical protein EHS24_009066 [Apiotrichum porosum]